MTITTTVTAYGGNIPARTDDQTTFNTNVNDILSYMGGDLSTEINSVATEMNALSVTVNGYKVDAATSESNAADSAALALANAGATVYDNATTYNYPDAVIGSNGGSYRCLGTSIIGDDPATSTTGNWLQLTESIVTPTIKTADFTATPNVLYMVDTTSGPISITLPSSPNSGENTYFADYAETWKTNSVTLLRNGEPIMGLSEDLIIDVDNMSIQLMYIDATQGWRLI